MCWQDKTTCCTSFKPTFVFWLVWWWPEHYGMILLSSLLSVLLLPVCCAPVSADLCRCPDQRTDFGDNRWVPLQNQVMCISNDCYYFVIIINNLTILAVLLFTHFSSFCPFISCLLRPLVFASLDSCDCPFLHSYFVQKAAGEEFCVFHWQHKSLTQAENKGEIVKQQLKLLKMIHESDWIGAIKEAW